jgi:hypothetical protein
VLLAGLNPGEKRGTTRTLFGLALAELVDEVCGVDESKDVSHHSSRRAIIPTARSHA